MCGRTDDFFKKRTTRKTTLSLVSNTKQIMASHRNRPQKPFTVCGWPRVRIPESCRGKEIVIGIDEAGRGPVLGSLVYCAAFWPADQNEEISKLGFDDSKQVKESERERLFEGIKNHPSIGWVIEELTAEEISEEMLRVDPVSLNAISYNTVIRALEIIRDGGRGHIAMESESTTITTSSSSGSSSSSSSSSSVFSSLAAMNMDPPIITDIFIDTVGKTHTHIVHVNDSCTKRFSLHSLHPTQPQL